MKHNIKSRDLKTWSKQNVDQIPFRTYIVRTKLTRSSGSSASAIILVVVVVCQSIDNFCCKQKLSMAKVKEVNNRTYDVIKKIFPDIFFSKSFSSTTLWKTNLTDVQVRVCSCPKCQKSVLIEGPSLGFFSCANFCLKSDKFLREHCQPS